MADRKEKNTHPLLSVVIGTLNRPEVVLKLLRQLIEYSTPLEVIVYDQSNQENYEKLKSEFPDNENYILKHLSQPNTCRYLNLGFKEAKAPIMLYLDDDVTLTASTIQAHLSSYDDKSIMGVAGRVINDNESIIVNNNIGKIYFYGAKIVKNFSGTTKSFVSFPYGANMSFRKKALEEVGGFDEKLSPPIYSYNEVDLGIRISKKWRNSIIFNPEALTYHHRYPHGGTRTFTDQEVNKSNQLNYGYFLGKNFNIFQNVICLLRRLPYQLIKEPKEVPNIIKGYIKGKHHVFTPWNILLASIFGLIIFLRFWKIPQLFNFTLAEEMQAHMSWEQVKNFHPVWIGVSAAYIKYYYGPGFLYLNSLLFYIAKDPVILGYFTFVLGMTTLFSIYHIAKNLFSKNIALFATIIYGVSALINYHDRRFWTPSPIPLITIWLIYSLIKAKGNTRWYILTAILIGSAFHLHMSLLLLLFPTLISVLLNIKKIKISTWLIMIGCYLILTSPLIVYDIVHNYDNLLMPLRVITANNYTELSTFTLSNTFNHAASVFSTLGRLWFLKFNTNPHDEVILESHFNMSQGNFWLSLLSVFALIYFFINNRRSGYVFFFIPLIIIPLSYILYPSYNPEYYLLSFITLMTVVIGFWLASLPKPISVIIIALFISANVITVINSSEKYGLTIRKQLVQQTMKVIGSQSFYLDMDGEINTPKKFFPYAGWRFLYKAYGKTPNQSSTDQLLGWLYPDEISQEKPQLKVIISDTIQPKFKEKPLSIFKSGPYYAYIFKNN